MIFCNIRITSAVPPPIFGAFKHIVQNRLDDLGIHSDASSNPLGFEWDWPFVFVIHIKQATVCQVLIVREVAGRSGVIANVKLKIVHGLMALRGKGLCCIEKHMRCLLPRRC